MQIVTAAQMRAIEERLFQTVPSLDVMEKAGRLLARYACRLSKGPFAIVCGKGNNGGDGFVAGRYLREAGLSVTLVCLTSPEQMTRDAATNYHRAGLTPLTSIPQQTGLIIDCVLGTGSRGAPRGDSALLIEMINASRAPVLACDLPSGVDADTGAADGAVRADYTLAIGLPKWGHVLYPGALHAGRLAVADIALQPQAVADVTTSQLPATADDEAQGPPARFTTAADVRAWLPNYRLDAHKGTRGKVLVVGGSPGMSGAPALAGQAALRSGAGLCTVAVPDVIQPIVAALAPEYTTCTLTQLPRRLPAASALAVGPGMGTESHTQHYIRDLVRSTAVPLVLDADGLRAFASNPGLLKESGAPLVLTPHPGEMAALVGTSVAEVQRDRLGVARRLAVQTGQTVLLKGALTLICASDGTTYVNPAGNRALGTGGSGDVLTGIIAGLLAQGLPALHAAAAGAFLHGFAAQSWSATEGLDGMLASDLVKHLPRAQHMVRTGAQAGMELIADPDDAAEVGAWTECGQPG